MHVRDFTVKWQSNNIGKSIWGQFTNLAVQTQSRRRVDGCHADDLLRLNVRMVAGEKAHFVKEIQFERLPTTFAHACQAVSAKANVDSSSVEFFKRKAVMLKKRMTARTMNDVDLCFSQQSCVTRSEIIRMDCEQIFSKRTGP